MISLTNILEDIKNDFVKEQYRNSIVLTRRFVLAKGNVISVSMNKNTDLCGIGIDISQRNHINPLSYQPDLPDKKLTYHFLLEIQPPNQTEAYDFHHRF